MNKRIFLPWKLGSCLHLVSLSILLTLPLSAQCRRTQSETANAEAKEVVARYLSFWQKGDYTSAYQLWGKNERSLITLDQLQSAFEIESHGSSRDKQQLQKITGLPYLVAGRPAHIERVEVRAISDRQATIDATASFSPLAQMGLGNPQLSANLIKQYLKPSRHGDGFASAMGVACLTHIERVDTSKGEKKEVHSVNGTSDITLYFHRFLLTRENGQWRISNAVKVSPTASNTNPSITSRNISANSVAAAHPGLRDLSSGTESNAIIIPKKTASAGR